MEMVPSWFCFQLDNSNDTDCIMYGYNHAHHVCCKTYFSTILLINYLNKYKELAYVSACEQDLKTFLHFSHHTTK